MAAGELRPDCGLLEFAAGLGLRSRLGTPQLMSVRIGTNAKAVQTSSRTFFIFSVLSGRMCLHMRYLMLPVPERRTRGLPTKKLASRDIPWFELFLQGSVAKGALNIHVELFEMILVVRDPAGAEGGRLGKP